MIGIVHYVDLVEYYISNFPIRIGFPATLTLQKNTRFSRNLVFALVSYTIMLLVFNFPTNFFLSNEHKNTFSFLLLHFS